MKFDRLRLVGFKSFVEPTDVPIEPGLTGIVGPNGCGKSNIADALQWVMGESSYKAMRGSEMEDVIFSGSAARPARNAAEVTLTLDNGDRTAPIAFGDADTIEVSRRIEREAGSAYRVNGREVRARDVQLLFADASAGAHSPALVGQGRIGAIISAKPEARRAILEEAAGISGLFGRRHEAELRLKAADQNLERLEDVLGEIDRQLEALRRQARQAVRYKALSGEIRKGEATALAVRYATAMKVASDAEQELNDASHQLAERGEAQGKAARDQAVAAASLPELRTRAAATASSLQRMRLEDERLGAEERAAAAQLVELDKRLAQLLSDIEREGRLLEENAAVVARLSEEEGRLNAEWSREAELRDAAASKLQAGEATLARSEALAAEAQNALAELKARRGQLERDLADAKARQQKLAGERARIEADQRQLQASEAVPRLEAAKANADKADQDLAGAEAAVQAATARTAEARTAESATRNAATESETAVARMEAEAKALRSLLPADQHPNPIADAVTTRDGADAALAAILGDELYLPEDASAAAHWVVVAPESPDAPLPDGARPLSEFIDAPPVLARRLSQAGIVDRADGPRLQALLRPGQALATIEGDLWRWDGLVAKAEARRSDADRLAGRKRLNDLNRRLAELKAVTTKAREQLTAAADATRAAVSAEAAAGDALRNARKAVGAAREAIIAAEREHDRNVMRLGALADAMTRLAEGIAEAAAAERGAEEALGRLAEPTVLEGPLAKLREQVTADRQQVAEARAAVAGLTREAEHRASRLRAIAGEKEAWRVRRTNGEAQVATLTERQAAATATRTETAARPAEIAAKRENLALALRQADAAKAEADDALLGAEAALSAADKVLKLANEALAETRERRGRAEERVGGARQRVQEFGAKIVEVLECKPEEAAATAGLDADNLPALDQVEQRVERLKHEREKLGGVNLQAEQEANALGERRTTMVADRDDLVAAIQKLRQGIGNLNREGRERLITAFTSVNEKFRELFVQLFGGGTAELKLVGSEDPLEAGLDIIAKPPGKKPQTMTLLSGGEQALTALSLIFAVFLTNPAPICLLDEVDAPLDDANVERFCNLLEEITAKTKTRFLVTTHNPITMARMNRLFGVTMAERGVSQLVSVDLETAERMRDAV